MVRGDLVMAIDFQRKKGDTANKVESALRDGVWYVYWRGPTYSNTFKVTEYDEAGLQWLRSHQIPESGV